ncbi:NUDIX domain-containing protein [Micromonospora maris]|uniref:NUDIX domain-containing protein n=1 Tax=Micromonospora maris TaxID=1003110 RepID=UPI0039F4DAAF
MFLQRAGTGEAAGQLCLPGGHLEDGESVVAGAIRETAEETVCRAVRDESGVRSCRAPPPRPRRPAARLLLPRHRLARPAGQPGTPQMRRPGLDGPGAATRHHDRVHRGRPGTDP